MVWRYSWKLSKAGRQPGARQFVEDGEPVGFQPGTAPAPERRRGAERQQVRQEIGQLVEELDPELLVLDADMDMHAADQHPLGDNLHRSGDLVVAFLVGMRLVGPFGEGMGRGRQRREVVGGGFPGDRLAEIAEFGAAPQPSVMQTGVPTSIWQRRNSGLTRPSSALSQALNSSAGGELASHAGGLVDEKVFLFNADAETGLFHP